MKAVAVALVLLLGAVAHAAPGPSVRELQRAAARMAEVHPERVRAWLKRVNAAALLPNLRVRVGRGLSAIQLRGLEAYVPASDAWSFQIEASWQLDRLVFDRSELGLSRESQRLSQRREALMIQVTRLYFERERLLYEAPETTPEGKIERRLAIDELTAILDGLTGGAMGARSP
jgi:hypothetical protein